MSERRYGEPANSDACSYIFLLLIFASNKILAFLYVVALV